MVTYGFWHSHIQWNDTKIFSIDHCYRRSSYDSSNPGNLILLCIALEALVYHKQSLKLCCSTKRLSLCWIKHCTLVLNSTCFQLSFSSNNWVLLRVDNSKNVCSLKNFQWVEVTTFQWRIRAWRRSQIRCNRYLRRILVLRKI